MKLLDRFLRWIGRRDALPAKVVAGRLTLDDARRGKEVIDNLLARPVYHDGRLVPRWECADDCTHPSHKH